MKRILNKWPQKLLALTLAIVAWFSIDQNTRSTSQRELTVPVVVEGRASDQTETGAPETVNITVSGETGQVNRLRPENFDAVLDLDGLNGEYEQTIDVVPPQGIRLLEIEPDTAIGVVESIRAKTVPVEAAVLGTLPNDAVITAASEPSEVVVRGRSSTLERVDKAVALIAVSPDGQREPTEIPLYAADAANKPVSEVVLEPNLVAVNLDTESVLHVRSVPLDVAEPEPAEGLSLNNFSLSKPTLRVAGSEAALASLESVSALVRANAAAATTQDLAAGEYTLEVAPRLPEGVSALERVSASFNLVALPPVPEDNASEDPQEDAANEDTPREDIRSVPTNEDEEATETDVDDAASPPSGEENDSTSTPVRGPGSAQDSGSDNNF